MYRNKAGMKYVRRLPYYEKMEKRKGKMTMTIHGEIRTRRLSYISFVYTTDEEYSNCFC